MPVDLDEFEDALRVLSQSIDELGYSIRREIDDETEDGDPVSGYVIDALDTGMLLYGCPEDHFFIAECSFDIIRPFIQQRRLEEYTKRHNISSIDIVAEKLERGEIDIDIEGATVEDFVDSADQFVEGSDTTELRFALVSELAHGRNQHTIEFIKDLIRGFTIRRTVFIHDNDFSTRRLAGHVQTLSNSAYRARMYLRDFYQIGDLNLAEDQKTENLEPSDDRSFM